VVDQDLLDPFEEGATAGEVRRRDPPGETIGNLAEVRGRSKIL
jgi:hypothetical protein